MRVLIYDGGSKAPTFVSFLADNLAREGHKVYLAGKGNNLLKQPTSKGALLVALHARSGYLLPFMLITCLIRLLINNPFKLFYVIRSSFKENRLSKKLSYMLLLAQLYSIKPEIIHIQWSQHVKLFQKVIDKGDFKFIVSFRGRLVNITPFVNDEVASLYRKIFPKIDGFHAVSESILKNGAKFGAEADKAMVINPAVDDLLFNLNGNHTYKRRKDNEPLRILSVGRHHWKKGYPDAIDACRLLKEKNIPFNYTIVAGGDTEELIYHIHDVGLSNEVELIDRLTHVKVLDAYTNAHVFLLPSFEEGIANVVLEAMMMGTPVISADCGGMSEVIKNKVNGWLVPLRDVEVMAQTIEDFYCADYMFVSRIVEEARKTIEKNHLQSLQTRLMVELYEKVIKN